MAVKPNFAYLLISCNIGKLDDVIENLRDLDNIKSVQGINGAYDVIAKVESITRQHLQRFIIQQIRTLVGVRSSLTLECKPPL